jgi:hypothetical protein
MKSNIVFQRNILLPQTTSSEKIFWQTSSHILASSLTYWKSELKNSSFSSWKGSKFLRLIFPVDEGETGIKFLEIFRPRIELREVCNSIEPFESGSDVFTEALLNLPMTTFTLPHSSEQRTNFTLYKTAGKVTVLLICRLWNRSGFFIWKRNVKLTYPEMNGSKYLSFLK